MLVVFGGFFWGCADETGPGPGVIEFVVDASSQVDSVWTYFSFDEGDTVRPADPESSYDWDLKFQRYRIGTNSGTSGPGEGGAVNVGNVDFDSYDEAPESGYVIDTMVTFTGHTGDYERSCNPVLTDWYTIAGMPPTFYAKDTVFIVKSAESKYAKVQVLDYYYYDEQQNRHSGYITFKYVYQPDGSRNF
ncbi:HmuY family protein [candidate division WOR-3 bacterium]|nr:HmuY family protein [candidate division WOR-3 bacterium]